MFFWLICFVTTVELYLSIKLLKRLTIEDIGSLTLAFILLFGFCGFYPIIILKSYFLPEPWYLFCYIISVFFTYLIVKFIEPTIKTIKSKFFIKLAERKRLKRSKLRQNNAVETDSSKVILTTEYIKKDTNVESFKKQETTRPDVYINHCWNCYETIHSDYQEKCSKCNRFYICSECENCLCDSPSYKRK